MKEIRVGIAGWNNPPSERSKRRSNESHLTYYSSCFTCVEINSSFYKSHRTTTYERWRNETPPQFRFSVKMPRSITHEAYLLRADREISKFYEEVLHLQPKLKAVLMQLPPMLEFNLEAARAFFRNIPRISGVALVCEPRHASWFSAVADALLDEFKVSRVAADPVRCVGADQVGGADYFAYFRWHGSPRMYYSKYSDAQLDAFATEVRNSKTKEVWCIFDNTAQYAAWDDAMRFRGLVT